MNIFSKRRSGVAATVAALVAFSSLTFTEIATAATPADIDTSRQGSIIVHKHETPASAENGNGRELAGGSRPTGKPINGVTFTVSKITGIDLSTPAGWSDLQSLTPAAAAGRVADTQEKVTTGNGEATFSSLPVGAYLVRETKKLDSVVKAADDFIVTIPHPSTSGGSSEWVYDVHVYPKNILNNKPTKVLDDSEAVKGNIRGDSSYGDELKWTVTQTLPELPAGQKFTEVRFTDLIPEGIDYRTTAVKVNGEDRRHSADTVRTLFVYYHASQTTRDDTVIPARTLEVRFLSTGAESLRAGDVITLEIKAKADNAGEFVNSIKSEITVANSDGSNPSTSTATSDPSGATRWGYFDVMKTAAGSSRTALKGAVFKVYSGSGCGVNSEIPGISEAKLTTAVNGKLPNKLLLKAGQYSVQEVRAPLGYVLGGSCTNVTIAPSNTFDSPQVYSLTNEKSSVPGLPLTGAQGQMFLIGAGGVLMLIGAVVVVALRRRQAASEA